MVGLASGVEAVWPIASSNSRIFKSDYLCYTSQAKVSRLRLSVSREQFHCERSHLSWGTSRLCAATCRRRAVVSASVGASSSSNIDPRQQNEGQTFTLDSVPGPSGKEFEISSSEQEIRFNRGQGFSRDMKLLPVQGPHDTSIPPHSIKKPPRRYSNKFIKWVKLGSVIDDAAQAFFKSEARRRTFITVVLLMICRAGQFIPLPGFDLRSIPSDYLMKGSSLEAGEGFYHGEPKLSFFQLGLGPYICASTLMQVVCSCYPPLQRMRKDGEVEKIKSYTWWMTFTCSVMQALMLSYATLEYSIAASTNPFKHILLTTSLMTLGALLLERISRFITDAGFGQGSTLIICMGILNSCSHSLHSMVSRFARHSFSEWGPALVLYVVVFLTMTIFAVLVTEGRRIIRLQFYGFDRFPSTGGVSEVEPYIPFDINPTGMLPVLMSSYLMALPGFLASILNFRFLRSLQVILNPALPPTPGAKPWLYHTLTAVFIFTFNVLDINDGAKDISEYINRIGAKIADVKPGRSTVEFLRKVQNSARSWGGILLALLVTVSTIVDYKLRSLHQAGSISFTSMLFIVGTIIEVRRSFMAYHAIHMLSKVLKRYGV